MPRISRMASTIDSFDEYTSPRILPHSSATTVANRPSARSERMHSASVAPRHSRLPSTSAPPSLPSESTRAAKATSTSSLASLPTLLAVTAQPGPGTSTRRALLPAMLRSSLSVAAGTAGLSLGSRKAVTPARSRRTSSAGPSATGSAAAPSAGRLAPTTRAMTRCAGSEAMASAAAPTASEEPTSQSKKTNCAPASSHCAAPSASPAAKGPAHTRHLSVSAACATAPAEVREASGSSTSRKGEDTWRCWSEARCSGVGGAASETSGSSIVACGMLVACGCLLRRAMVYKCGSIQT